MVKVYVELVTNDVQVVHEYHSIVVLHVLKEQDQWQVDLEKHMIMNQLSLDEVQ